MSADVEKIVREYIDKSIHMSLATVKDNKPWVCELHFAYDQDLNLYWRSLESRRHSLEIADNPQVAGNIVGQHAKGEIPHGIYFEGIAELITGETMYPELFSYFQQRQGVSDSIIEEAKKVGGHKFYKITVANWYTFGKFDEDSVGKHELAWNGGRK